METKGKVSAILGAVVDVNFEGHELPEIYNALELDNNGQDTTKACAMAKRFATDIGFEICNQALQLHGGYGYIKEYDVERFFRDAKILTIGEGTSEIQRIIIAREILNNISSL